MPPDTTAPALPMQTNEPPPAKRKRAKRADKPKVDAPPKKPRAPSVTLLARIKAMGEHHVAAYRILQTDAFDATLRAEWSHAERVGSAKARLDRAETEFAAAKGAFKAILESPTGDGECLKELDDLARIIATKRGAMPDAPADAIMDGAEPDTGRSALDESL